MLEPSAQKNEEFMFSEIRKIHVISWQGKCPLAKVSSEWKLLDCREFAQLEIRWNFCILYTVFPVSIQLINTVRPAFTSV